MTDPTTANREQVLACAAAARPAARTLATMTSADRRVAVRAMAAALRER
ncbi:MAG: hypothetical protein INR72_16760, partial [Williamsia herbipolensis]|nr:hypothetical protein [Williamsia herbipolensis]